MLKTIKRVYLAVSPPAVDAMMGYCVRATPPTILIRPFRNYAAIFFVVCLDLISYWKKSQTD